MPLLKELISPNAKIKDLKNGSGSTVSVAEISGTQIRNYHVGDSLTLAYKL